MRERVLVTGALGCLGIWTMKELCDQGFDPIGFDIDKNYDRFDSVFGQDVRKRMDLVRGDVTRFAELAETAARHYVAGIIHLAALQIPFCHDDPVRGAMVNVVGTVNALEVGRQMGHKRRHPVVYTSSAAIYGPEDRARAAVDEQAHAHPSTHYGVYKVANEGSARIYWREHGVPSIGLRLYNVFGPGRDQGVTAAPTAAIRAGVLRERYTIPYGGQVLFKFVNDESKAIVVAYNTDTQDATVMNVPGMVEDVAEFVCAIERNIPEAQGLIDFNSDPLPLAGGVATGEFERVVGRLEPTSLDDGIKVTREYFARLRSQMDTDLR